MFSYRHYTEHLGFVTFRYITPKKKQHTMACCPHTTCTFLHQLLVYLALNIRKVCVFSWFGIKPSGLALQKLYILLDSSEGGKIPNWENISFWTKIILCYYYYYYYLKRVLLGGCMEDQIQIGEWLLRLSVLCLPQCVIYRHCQPIT
jgi:hypothetical protein